MKKSKLCSTCALKEKEYPYQGSCPGDDSIQRSFHYVENGIEKCSYYFNVYVWRKEQEEKRIEIERKKEIARKNRERPLSQKPFTSLRGFLL